MSFEAQIAWAKDVVAEDTDGVFEVFKKRPQNVFCKICEREMHPKKAESHKISRDHMTNVDRLPSSSDEDEDGDEKIGGGGGATIVGVSQREAKEAIAKFPDCMVVCPWRPQNIYCVVCERELAPHNAASHVRIRWHVQRLEEICLADKDDGQLPPSPPSSPLKDSTAASSSKGVGWDKAVARAEESKTKTTTTTAAVSTSLAAKVKAMESATASASSAAPGKPAVSSASELERTAYTMLEIYRRDYGPYFVIEDARAVAAFRCTLCRDRAPALSATEVEDHARSAAHKAERQYIEEEALRASHLRVKRNEYHKKWSGQRGYGGHGDRPDAQAHEELFKQLKVSLPYYDLPPHYANLCATDFPSRDALRSARGDLIRFARNNLSTVVPMWDPFALSEALCDDNDNPNATGVRLTDCYPYPIICDHLRKLYESIIHIEEAAGAMELRAYNKTRVTLRPHRGGGNNPHSSGNNSNPFNRFEVDMPGVSENRPSVLRGDKLHIHCDSAGGGGGGGGSGIANPNPTTSRTFYAYVHFVNLDTIVFSMPKTFVFDGNATYSIVFRPSRTQERKLHRAVQMIPNTAMLLRETCAVAFEGVGGVQHSTAFRPPITLTAASAWREGAVKTIAKLNEPQQLFIAHVHGPNRLSVLWGPPGTGKTTTLVAAIVDTVLRAPKSSAIRLLVCAPSNEAADLIAERIIANEEVKHLAVNNGAGANGGGGRFMLRLPSASRDPKLLPEVLLPFCPKTDGASSFLQPSAEETEKYTIVITTLMTCDRLFSFGVKGEHFSHLFIDEAGHATEPLLMIALNTARGGAFGCGTKVILAGDHKQLGPRITVPTLIEGGVHESPLLRIFNDKPMWAEVGSQLSHCYRSHPAIVHLINTCYDDTLMPTVAAENTFRLFWGTPLVYQRFWQAHCRVMKGLYSNGSAQNCGGALDETAAMALAHYSRPLSAPPAAPILCLDHSYPESREDDSPSWMNSFEVGTVCDIVFTLWEHQLIKGFDEVAVITPYRKQVQKISDRIYSRMLGGGGGGTAAPSSSSTSDLSRHLIWNDPRTGAPLRRPRIPVKVATVDSYQGREARVVIVSCVRSHTQAMRQDAHFGLGFLNQPERANVSLSRAKDLLIIIGNREVLSSDPMWARYYSRLDGMGEGVVMRLGGHATMTRTSEFEDDDEDGAMGGRGATEGLTALLEGAFEEKGGVAREE